MPLDPDAPIHVAGHRGLVGSALWRQLQHRGHTALLGASSAELDLRDRDAVFAAYDRWRPHHVIMAAARVGGIGANQERPADFLSDNVRMQTNVIDAAHAFDVRRLLFLGSSCIYPRLAPQPIIEESLLTGRLEPTNEAYAIAKITGVLHVQAMRRQHGRAYISAMPTNLYGPGDNFDPATSHVLPAMITRFHHAVTTGEPEVTLWGSGNPRREFLHVDDLAAGCLTLLERYDGTAPVNVGSGVDRTIAELAALVAEITGYSGRIRWDTTRPDGTPRKLLDVSRLAALDWRPKIELADGIAATYAWYRTALHGSPEPRPRSLAALG